LDVKNSLGKSVLALLLSVTMELVHKHVLQAEVPTFRRIGQPAEDPIGLIEWLNNEQSGASANEVVALTRELKVCQGLAVEFLKTTSHAGSKHDRMEKAQAVSKSQKRLNSLLKDIVVAPMIFPPVGLRAWIAATWIPVKNGRRLTKTPGIGQQKGLATALDELNAVLTVLALAGRGTIDRVRECGRAGCHKWLFARKSRHRFCTEKCQQENYKSTYSWRASRREYMRRYRLVLRQRDLDAIRRAKGKR
jgi:hypothetical protein